MNNEKEEEQETEKDENEDEKEMESDGLKDAIGAKYLKMEKSYAF